MAALSFESFQKALDFLRRRRLNYIRTFQLGNRDAEEVLADLAKFCRANTSAFDPDPRIHAALEGRREVWLRIQNHLNLTAEDLYKLTGGQSLSTGDNDA